MPEKSSSLSYDGEVVHITLTSLNGTLSYVRWTICPSTSKLSNSMPVYGDIVGNMIDHLNHNSVTFSCSNSRTRELPVHCNHALCVAQPRNISQPYIKLVVPCNASML
ncbi:hypothetical protein V8G54_024685 [Vigna mungo]|uniref:Uncharacterized protein n=1 Tax=Vigna mungo TaxID=3915 RepID=A0AAQ3RQC8_VIGMU